MDNIFDVLFKVLTNKMFTALLFLLAGYLNKQNFGKFWKIIFFFRTQINMKIPPELFPFRKFCSSNFNKHIQLTSSFLKKEGGWG